MFPKRLLLLVCLGASSCTFPDAPRTAPAPDPVKKTQPSKPDADGLPIDPRELFVAFEKTPGEAEKEFKGKVLIVESTIQAVGDDGGSPNVDLIAPVKGGGAYIRCLFDPSKQAEVASRKPGGHATIKGRCAGAGGGFVILEGCTIIRYREPK